MKNPDEVVAYNVKRLRLGSELSVAELAGQLGVKSHVVYDYEGTRKDKPQRPFRWQEIVNLCLVLNTTLFELVLPPEGAESFTYLPGLPAEIVEKAGMPILAKGLVHDFRAEMGWWLFGLDGKKLDSKALEVVLSNKRKELDRRSEIIRGITDEMWKRLEEAHHDQGEET